MKRKRTDDKIPSNEGNPPPPAKRRRRDSYISGAFTSILRSIQSLFTGASATAEELVGTGIDVNTSSLEEEEDSATPNNSLSVTKKVPVDSKSSPEEEEQASTNTIPTLHDELIAKILDYIPSEIQTRQVCKRFQVARNYMKLDDLREVRQDFLFKETFLTLPYNYHIEGLLEERLHFLLNKEAILRITKNKQGEINETIKKDLEILKFLDIASPDHFLFNKVLDSLNHSIILSQIYPRGSMISLLCSDCFLTRFPSSLLRDEKLDVNKIRSINLRRNKLSTLPAGLSQLANLKGLIVSNNCLRNLPEDIGKIANLATLELDDNQLSNLPDLKQLTKLKMVSVTNNLLDSEPDIPPGIILLLNNNPCRTSLTKKGCI